MNQIETTKFMEEHMSLYMAEELVLAHRRASQRLLALAAKLAAEAMTEKVIQEIVTAHYQTVAKTKPPAA